MLATATSAALHGVEARLVRIEADISGGFPRFTMLRLPDSGVKEIDERTSFMEMASSRLPPRCAG